MHHTHAHTHALMHAHAHTHTHTHTHALACSHTHMTNKLSSVQLYVKLQQCDFRPSSKLRVYIYTSKPQLFTWPEPCWGDTGSKKPAFQGQPQRLLLPQYRTDLRFHSFFSSQIVEKAQLPSPILRRHSYSLQSSCGELAVAHSVNQNKWFWARVGCGPLNKLHPTLA